VPIGESSLGRQRGIPAVGALDTGTRHRGRLPFIPRVTNGWTSLGMGMLFLFTEDGDQAGRRVSG
jgi:hypothetical protein